MKKVLFSILLSFSCGTAIAQAAKPQYGGTLEVGTVYITLSALSWDPADFNWKHNHDTGQFYNYDGAPLPW